MREGRDERLTKALGDCWHDFQCIGDGDQDRCIHCRKIEPFAKKRIDFSSGDGFMILWDWATISSQRWNTRDKYGDFWPDFCRANGGGYLGGFITIGQHLIHPDRFADKLDEFLHGGKDE